MVPLVLATLVFFCSSATQPMAQLTERPVTIVVPFTAGTGVDILARILAQELQPRLQRSVMVENKPGASGNIGTLQVARAAPDGNTLLLTAPSHVISNLAPFRKFDFDPEKSFEPVNFMAKGALALTVNKAVGANSVTEYLTLVRANPGKFNYASTGPFSAQHLAMELFKESTQTNVVHVPYAGSAGAIQDIVAGHVQVMFMPLHTALPLVDHQPIRLLAIASNQRSPLAPNVPTLAESGVRGAEVELWYGLLAPVGTPKEVVNRYNVLTAEILKLPKVRDDLGRQGLDIVGEGPEDFRSFITSEVVRWERVVNNAGLIP